MRLNYLFQAYLSEPATGRTQGIDIVNDALTVTLPHHGSEESSEPAHDHRRTGACPSGASAAMGIAGLLTFAAVVAFVLLVPPRFRSEALLRVESKRPRRGSPWQSRRTERDERIWARTR